MLRTVVLAGAAVWGFQAQAPETATLKLYWHGDRGDNFTTATPVGQASAVEAGYAFARDEGLAFATEVPGTIPLKLYWSDKRSDNLTLASPESERAATADGYGFARVEGYIYPADQPGTLPLKLFYSERRGDYFTTASAVGEQAALASGYKFVRVEGYVLPVAQAPATATAPSASRPIYMGRAKPVDRVSPSRASSGLPTATEALRNPAPDVAAPDPEPPQPSGWTIPPLLVANQGNDARVEFSLIQNGTQLTGTAKFLKWEKGSCFFLIGCNPSTAQRGSGSVDGTLEGNKISLMVYWGGSSIGVYEGLVGDRGRIEGMTFDRLKPDNKTHWFSQTLLTWK